MKLLFDENLSFRLPERLADIFPASAHIRDLGLISGRDGEIWRKAATGGFVLVTLDRDFLELAARLGPPPKIILIRMRNGPTSAIETLLREARLPCYCSIVNLSITCSGWEGHDRHIRHGLPRAKATLRRFRPLGQGFVSGGANQHL